MTVARNVAEVLNDHVTLEIESIDRMYLNLYQPRLQHAGGVVGFFRSHRGMPIASSALMAPMTRDFVAAIHRFVDAEDVPLVDFASRCETPTTSPAPDRRTTPPRWRRSGPTSPG